MPRLLPTVLAVCLVIGCEEKPTADSTAKAAVSAPVAAAPSAPAPPPTPAAEARPAPKPKKKLEDCPKGPTVTFDDPGFEAAVRLKASKPDGALTTADLRRLKSLNLSQVKLSELDVCLFAHMTGLKELFLGPGDYDDLSPIAGATQLESLRASINQVRDLAPLEKMTRLDRLDLGRTQIANVQPLAGLKKLTELQLDDTPLDDVSALAGLTEL